MAGSSVLSAYTVLLPPICSALALLLCLGARPLTERLRLLDIPGGRKSHKRPTPLMGGLVLLLAFCPWTILWVGLGAQQADVLLPIIGCTAALTVLGLIDDRRHLPATLRLAVCLLCIGFTLGQTPHLVLKSISWNYDRGSFMLPPIIGLIFSTLSIVALIQAANLADGKNGLLIGMCLAWVYYLSNHLPDSMMPFLMGLGAILIVLLAFNLTGGLFLGDGGSYGFATLIGFLALFAASTPLKTTSSDQIALLFLLPVTDMIRLSIVRIARGQSPFVGDRDHLHHHLLAAFGWPGGLATYLMLVIVPSLVSNGAPRNTLTLIAVTAVTYFGVIAYARRVGDKKADSRPAS